MKTKLSLVMLLALVCTFAFVGCNKNDTSSNMPETPATNSPDLTTTNAPAMPDTNTPAAQ